MARKNDREAEATTAEMRATDTHGYELQATEPAGQPPAPYDERQPEEVQANAREKEQPRQRTVASSTWAALIIGAILLILLLVFIMQNQDSVELQVFAWQLNFPIGVGMLLSAITGALIMAIFGGWRMVELNREVKKLRRK